MMQETVPQPPPSDDTALPRAILSSCALSATAVHFLAQGATGPVWRADTAAGPLVIRVGAPRPGKEATFVADVGVRQRLHAQDLPVAEPLALGRWDAATSGSSTDIVWCI